MSLFRCRVLCLTVLSLIAPAALAWGPQGHAIVADIAQAHLDPAAQRAVTALLAQEGAHDLDQVSSWPDQIRKDHPETGPWHYVDIPLRASRYSRHRDCPQGDCVVVKLPHYVRVLADRSASPQVRLEALKWAVHLVGDIHQPLHDVNNDDKGGNEVKLMYFGQATNLHRIWDTDILEHALHLNMGPHYSFDHHATRAAARRLDAQITPAERVAWSCVTPLRRIDAEAVTWTDASHRLARTVAYGALPSRRDGHWSAAYQARSWPLLRRQLQKAGVRLAGVLNAALR